MMLLGCSKQVVEAQVMQVTKVQVKRWEQEEGERRRNEMEAVVDVFLVENLMKVDDGQLR